MKNKIICGDIMTKAEIDIEQKMNVKVIKRKPKSSGDELIHFVEERKKE